MDIQRVLLFIALTFVLLLLWQAWYDEQRVAPPQPVATDEAAPPVARDVPEAPRAEAPPGEAAVPTADRGALPRGPRVRVRTDVYDLAIDTVGGDIREVLLPGYPVAADRPDEPYRLMNDTGRWLFVAQNGLLPGQPGLPAPDHYAQFEAEQTSYTLAPGADTLQVPLRWQAEGLTVTKTYTFTRGSYLVNVDVTVENTGAEPWRGHFYRQLQRTEQVGEETPWFIYTYSGGVVSTAERRYEKVSFSDMARNDLSLSTRGGWAAMIQHYFLGAWITPEDEAAHIYSRTLDGARYVIGSLTPEQVVEPGAAHRFETALFVGPKLQDQLREAAPNLALTVDYGFLTILADPLFWLLDKIHNLVGNWGWAIVILTLLIKLVFYKPSAISYRSMAKMRKVHPRLMALKERYGDDRQKLNQAMMDMYKKEKINPLAGCLPILIQIPVFIALYWVLLESVELRQADFMLWINDLSARDPFYVLPLLMGLTMFVQQRLNPAPIDPIQAKVLMMLPIVFTVFFAFFPAGLVLYWVVNNTVSIAQQWYVTRHVVKA